MMDKSKKRQSKALGPMILLITQYLTRIMGPLIAILLVRYLGTDDYGLYASAIAVTSFLSFLPEFGLQQSILKISVETDLRLNKLIKNALYTSFLYTLFTLLFLISWLTIFQYEPTIKLIAYLSSITFIRIAVLKVMTTVLQIKREFTRIAIWSVSINASQWIITITCMILKQDIISLVFWPQFVSVLITLLMLIIEGKKIKLFSNLNPFEEKGNYKNLIKNSLEFGTANSMYQMYHHSDAMILSATRNPVEVGYYNVAFRVSELVNFFATVLFNQVLYPIFFKWSKHNREKYLNYYRMLNKLMIIFGFLATTIIILFSNELIYIIFGSQEYFSVHLLNIMILAVPLRYLVVSLGAILTTDNLIRERIKVQSKIAVVNIGTNALFVPIYGPVAAAILLVVTDLLLFFGYLKTTNIHVTKKHFSKKVYYQIPILIGIVISVYYLSSINLLLKIVFGFVICFAYIIIGLLSLEKNEMKEFKRIIKR